MGGWGGDGFSRLISVKLLAMALSHLFFNLNVVIGVKFKKNQYRYLEMGDSGGAPVHNNFSCFFLVIGADPNGGNHEHHYTALHFAGLAGKPEVGG
jgi:hypothetical protein